MNDVLIVEFALAHLEDRMIADEACVVQHMLMRNNETDDYQNQGHAHHEKDLDLVLL